MEVDFDKEIDTLLRKAHCDAPVLIGDFASSDHLDADAISAFAENAMPEKSRALYSAHLADCDRCRKILSNLLVMNAEDAPAAAPALSAITIAERVAEPWYKRLFLFPNLAYVMGSLVLLFAGFLGYTVIRNSTAGDSLVSQVSESEAPSARPNFQSDAPVTSNTNSASFANSAANMPAANATTLAPSEGTGPGGPRPLAEGSPVAGARGSEDTFVLDGVDSATATGSAAPPPAPPPAAAEMRPVARDADKERDDAKLKVEEKSAGAPIDMAKGDISKDRYSVPAQSGPMRNSDSQYNRQMENMQRGQTAAKRSATRSEAETASGRKVVNGKTFDRKQSVWYDSTYQGRPTINVRRGTDEYNRLDGGLRSIANQLGGTIVVVWGAKAYRIQ